MATLYTVTYPELQEDDYAWIEHIRRTYDPQFALIRPHFTLVFGCNQIEPLEYVKHVESIAEDFDEVTFTCNSVAMHSEDESSYLYLIPNRGNEKILEMHRRLHAGAFKTLYTSKHRFTPHLTLAKSRDGTQVQQLANQVNLQPLSISGKLSTIEVCSVQAGALTTLAQFNVQA
jgi:2'-5' RNA ligase